jgi:hypothetical protein
MTIKGFYLVGQNKNLFHQDVHIDQYHDFEALQLAVAEQYNIIEAAGAEFEHIVLIQMLTLHQESDCKMPMAMTFPT